jgi:eukaryotic-like serine/threonine-protein kinase
MRTGWARKEAMPVQGAGRALLADRYELGEELSRGGMGVVWHARDHRLWRDVAIKEVCLPPEVPATHRRTTKAR